MLLDFDPAVAAVGSQPFWLHWKDGRRSRRHAPDFLAAQPLPASRAPALEADGSGGQPATGPGASPGGGSDDGGQLARVIPMPIFDPFAEADKPW